MEGYLYGRSASVEVSTRCRARHVYCCEGGTWTRAQEGAKRSVGGSVEVVVCNGAEVVVPYEACWVRGGCSGGKERDRAVRGRAERATREEEVCKRPAPGVGRLCERVACASVGIVIWLNLPEGQA